MSGLAGSPTPDSQEAKLVLSVMMTKAGVRVKYCYPDVIHFNSWCLQCSHTITCLTVTLNTFFKVLWRHMAQLRVCVINHKRSFNLFMGWTSSAWAHFTVHQQHFRGKARISKQRICFIYEESCGRLLRLTEQYKQSRCFLFYLPLRIRLVQCPGSFCLYMQQLWNILRVNALFFALSGPWRLPSTVRLIKTISLS